MRRTAARPSDCRVWFDADVAAFFGISTKTVRRRLDNPVQGEIDLNAAHPQRIGSRRLWLRADVEMLVGIGKAPEARRGVM